jgi:hypothetical protein
MPVSESDRDRLTKRQIALLLAASDMEQAAAAAHALTDEEDYRLARALETAIAVCYARAFTQSTLYRLDRAEYEPAASHLSQLHNDLYELRNKAYAHTDEESGRLAKIVLEAPVELPGRVDFLSHETWGALNREVLPAALELFSTQRARFLEEAGKLKLWLDGPERLGH